MIVPQYWAEGITKGAVNGRKVTIRRFGWSDASQDDAQAMADRRAQEAFELFTGGEEVARRELKIPYNGAEGVPIREEIVERHGDAVVTRNSYGARCLNTPNVLFADIDFEDEPSIRMLIWTFLSLQMGAIVIGVSMHSWAIGLVAAFVALLFSAKGAAFLFKLKIRVTGGEESRAQRRVSRFVLAHPDWHLRLYRTPAGFRVLAMHRTFEPDEAEVGECFSALDTDPVYVRMCKNQRCFRARLSAKPWRIGVDHIQPQPGVWPINPARLPERRRWIEDYERRAKDYAACHFVEALGSGRVDPTARAIQAIHDDLCQATSQLPMA